MSQEARNLPDQFRHCSNLMRRMYHQSGPMNTRHGQGKLMHYLLAMDGATQKDLAKEMRMYPASLADVVRQAECNGFVTVAPNADDSRSTGVFLTDEGRAIAEKRAAANDRVAEEIFADFTDEERMQLEGLLAKLSDSLEKKATQEDDEDRRCNHRSRRSRRYDGHRKCGGRRMRKNDQFVSRG